MTDIFHAEANAPIEIAPLDVAPPAPVKSDWSAMNPGVAQDAKMRGERRGAIEAARAKVEGGWTRPGQLTKAERLAQANSKGDRETSSSKERHAIRGSVQRAMEKVSPGVDRDEARAARSEMRTAVETLRQRYPGRSASDFVKIAKDWDASYKADPVGTREKILEQYASVSPENFRDFKAPEKASGARGSVRQAIQDQKDATDLAPFEKEFGHKLPAVLAELVRHDTALVNDPVGTSARLAANYGSPVTAAQEQAYVQKRAAEQHRTQELATVDSGLRTIIERKLLPGLDDEATLHAIAAALEEMNKKSERTGDRGKDFQRAHAHVMAARTAAKQDDRGSKSISGGPSTSGGPGRDQSGRNRTAVGAAVSRAAGRI